MAESKSPLFGITPCQNCASRVSNMRKRLHARTIVPTRQGLSRTEARLWAALQFRLLARLSAIEHAEMGDFQEAMLDRCFRLMEDGG